MKKQLSKKFISAVLVGIIAVTSVFFTGCTAESVNSKPQAQSGSTSYGELGFITNIVCISESDSIIYLLQNDKKDVYAVMGYADHELFVDQSSYTKDSFQVTKLTDDFKAKMICEDNFDSASEKYFYILDTDGKVHKYTVTIGTNYGTSSQRDNAIVGEMLDIPGKVMRLCVTLNNGNYALTDSNEVYAWYNCLNGSFSRDYREFRDGQEVISDAEDLKDKAVGFDDGLRHDTPTKLSLTEIKDMSILNEITGEMVYLNQAGDVIRPSYDWGNETFAFVKMDKMEQLQEIYPVSQVRDEYYSVIGRNINGEYNYYDLDFDIRYDTRIVNCGFSSAKELEIYRVANDCYFAEGSDLSDLETNYFNDMLMTDDGEVYSVTGYTGAELFNEKVNVDTTVDYLSVCGKVWLDNEGRLYWYSEENKNESYIVAENVIAYRTLENDMYEFPYSPEVYMGENFEDGLGFKTFIYFADGSVKILNNSDGQLLEVSSEYFGNGSFGRLVPSENGKYKVCSRIDREGNYETVGEFELP